MPESAVTLIPVVVGTVVLIIFVIEMIGRVHPLAAVVIYGAVASAGIYQVSREKSKAQKGKGWFSNRALSGFAAVLHFIPTEVGIGVVIGFLVVLFGTTAAFLAFICKGLNAFQPEVFVFAGDTESVTCWFWYGIELQLQTMMPFVELRKNVIHLSGIEPKGEVAGKLVDVMRWAVAAYIIWIVFCVYKTIRAVAKSQLAGEFVPVAD